MDHHPQADINCCRFSLAGLYVVLGAAAVPALTLALCAGVWINLSSKAHERQELAARLAPKPVMLDATAFARGQQLYTMACIACHGAEGQGVPGLGKGLRTSRFTRGLSDAQLVAFINEGRPADHPLNTTRVPMPPRGGRADFNDHNVADVVVYLRGLADPRRVPAGPLPDVEVIVGDPAPADEAPLAVATVDKTAAPAAVNPVPATPSVAVSAPAAAPAAVATGALDPQAITRGKRAYMSCIACHGRDAVGVKNMGKPLVANPFVTTQSDDALLDFIKKGRLPGDPGNTTKIAMPPKGGNPALKDDQIRDIIVYLRSLQDGAGSDAAGATASAAPTIAKPAAPAAGSASPAPVAAAPVAVQPATPAAPSGGPSPAAPPAAAVTAPAPTAPPAATAAPSRVAVVASGDAILRGKRAYMSCMACHGREAGGVKNMGKDLVNSPFVVGSTDDVLVDFIKKGRMPGDPGNTTNIAMPPKGGNPALKDEQIRDIVAYLRSLRQSARTE